MMNPVEDFSNKVWEDLGSPTSLSIAAISGWTYANIGKLNIKIDSCFAVSGDSFNPEFDSMVSGIYMEMYKVKFYESKIRDALNGISTNGTGLLSIYWTQLKEGDTTITRASPSEMVKSYRGLKTEASQELQRLIDKYNSNEAMPNQVAGDEFLDGVY